MVATILRNSGVFGLIQKKTSATLDEWLEFRKNFLTASELGACLGNNPYKSRDEIITEKIFGRTEKRNEYMQDGLRRESNIAAMLARKTGLTVTEINYFIFSEDHRLGASLDRLVKDTQGNLVALEIKTVGEKVFQSHWKNGPPKHVNDQLWLQSALFGEASYGHVAAYNRDTDIHTCYKTSFKQSEYSELIDISREFWVEVNSRS